jgi:hypothetical protein
VELCRLLPSSVTFPMFVTAISFDSIVPYRSLPDFLLVPYRNILLTKCEVCLDQGFNFTVKAHQSPAMFNNVVLKEILCWVSMLEIQGV